MEVCKYERQMSSKAMQYAEAVNEKKWKKTGNCIGQWLLKGWQASYTVEASFMVPILIGAMVIAMRMGICCYGEVRSQNEHETVCAMWEVKEFYNYQILEEIVDD